MVVESTLKVVTLHLYTMNVNSALTLQPSLNLVFLEIGQSEVEHSILMFTQFSTCIKHAAQVYFQENHATEYSGAIYVVDLPGPRQFLSQ